MNKDTKLILAVLIRKEFDSLEYHQLEDAAPKLIAAASEIGLNKLAAEMRSDLNFELKRKS